MYDKGGPGNHKSQNATLPAIWGGVPNGSGSDDEEEQCELSVCLTVWLSLFVCVSVCLFVSGCLFLCLSVCLPISICKSFSISAFIARIKGKVIHSFIHSVSLSFYLSVNKLRYIPIHVLHYETCSLLRDTFFENETRSSLRDMFLIYYETRSLLRDTFLIYYETRSLLRDTFSRSSLRDTLFENETRVTV